MEDLLKSIPKLENWKTEKGEIISHGFCLRFSPERDKWLCGYGKNFRPTHKDKYYIEADDPVEALAFFVELLNKN